MNEPKKKRVKKFLKLPMIMLMQLEEETKLWKKKVTGNNQFLGVRLGIFKINERRLTYVRSFKFNLTKHVAQERSSGMFE